MLSFSLSEELNVTKNIRIVWIKNTLKWVLASLLVKNHLSKNNFLKKCLFYVFKFYFCTNIEYE